MIRPFAILAALVVLGTGVASGQTRPVGPGSSAIRGRVVDAQSGEPLAGVVVRLFEPPTGRTLEQKTTTGGAYGFSDIADGVYTVTASSKTHTRSCHGALDSLGLRCASVSVVRDQALAGVDIRLPHGATIRGHVIDHDGRAVAGARVSSEVALGPGNSAATDARGAFQLTNIPPGENRLVVDPPATPDGPRPPTTNYPDDRTFLEISPGMVVADLTIALPRLAVSTITAHVSASTPAVEGLVVSLASAMPRMQRRLDLSTGGVATVKGLLEGRYFVFARAQSKDGTLAAFEVVDVALDSYDVSLLLQPTGRITGRIVAERGGVPPLDGVKIAAPWLQDGADVEPLARNEVDAGPDGYFRIDDLFGRRTLQLMGFSSEWKVQSVKYGRADITTSGVDVPSAAVIEVTITVARQ